MRGKKMKYTVTVVICFLLLATLSVAAYRASGTGEGHHEETQSHASESSSH